MIVALGRMFLDAARHLGGMTLLALATLGCLFRLRVDRAELLRNLHKMGVQSVPIVLLTAFFTGGIMVIQSGIFVKRFGAYGLLGFAAGYATLREVGPILIGLMFSGRVGANNTAELGTMTVTEQLDGLREGLAACRVLQKPFAGQVLVATVRELLATASRSPDAQPMAPS